MTEKHTPTMDIVLTERITMKYSIVLSHRKGAIRDEY